MPFMSTTAAARWHDSIRGALIIRNRNVGHEHWHIASSERSPRENGARLTHLHRDEVDRHALGFDRLSDGDNTDERTRRNCQPRHLLKELGPLLGRDAL